MEVYIVMIGTSCANSYSGTEWMVDTVFNSRESAQKYIDNEINEYPASIFGHFEFDIDVYEVKT